MYKQNDNVNDKHATPTISVVMPVYNVEDYLKCAITSVLQQSFTDYELIIVDDGSTDNSYAIYQQFADSDHRLKLIWQANQGLAAARNTGIRNAKGEFIAFLDSDDYWHPEKLQAHLNLLKANPQVGVSYSASAFIDEHGEHLGLHQSPKYQNVQAKDVLLRNPVGNGSAPVIRKAVFNDIAFLSEDPDMHHNHQYFNETLRQSEDIECWVRIATTTSWQFMGVNQALTYYRVNNSGLSANVEKQFQSWMTACDLMKGYAPKFMKQYFLLAAAFQYRYLSRRAIRSRDSTESLRLISKALRTQPKILLLEPLRTLNSVMAALCLQLPRKWYLVIEKTSIGVVSIFQNCENWLHNKAT